MVIDDSMPDRFIADKIITRAGIAGITLLKESARVALEDLAAMKYENEIPQLIFLDIRMPDMDGFDFLEQFETLPELVRKKARVIMLSSSSYIEDRRRAEAYDFVVGFISKPLNEKNLLEYCDQLFPDEQKV